MPISDGPARSGAAVRVAVVAGDPLVRAGLERLLEDGGLEVTEPDDPSLDAVVWDPGPGDLELLDRLSELDGFGAPVVAVVPGVEHAAAALAAGAGGVLARAGIGASLASAVRAAAQCLTVLDRDVAASLVPAAPPRADIEELTGRERQVVELMSSGRSNRAIADELGISEHTAKFHVNSVLAKLGATTRTEAVVEAIRRGLVTL